MAAIPTGRLKMPAWISDTWRDIDHFWFATTTATSMGVFRILIGFGNLANLLLILPFFDAWYSERGFTPLAATDRASPPLARDFFFFNFRFELPFTMPKTDVFSNVTNSGLFLACYIALIVLALLTMLGLWTRVSSILLAIGIVSLQHRNVLILHGGDSVLRLGAIYMAIAPSGKACSLDRLIGLWRGRLKPGPVRVSVWPQRIIAFNLALIYFTTWWVKLDGDRWRGGSASWFPAHLNEFHRFWVPPFMLAPWMVPFLTYGTLATELALGTIVFWRPARKWVLLAGLMMHGYIEYSMNIPLFGLGMCSYYVAFYEGPEVTAWAKRVGQRLKHLQLIVLVPKRTPLDSGPALAIQATDAFELITYEESNVERLDSGEVRNTERAIWTRSPGAWLFGLVPGLWRRMMNTAFQLGTSA